MEETAMRFLNSMSLSRKVVKRFMQFLGSP
jgi:hypothetical protein